MNPLRFFIMVQHRASKLTARVRCENTSCR